MDLVSLLIALIVIGAVLYVVSLLPIDATIKTIIKVGAIVVLAIWLLRALAPALAL
jgi:hypothetical protein